MKPFGVDKTGIDFDGNGKVKPLDYALLEEAEKELKQKKKGGKSGCCFALFLAGGGILSAYTVIRLILT